MVAPCIFFCGYGIGLLLLVSHPEALYLVMNVSPANGGTSESLSLSLLSALRG